MYNLTTNESQDSFDFFVSTTESPRLLMQLHERLVARRGFDESQFLDIYDTTFMQNVLFAMLPENSITHMGPSKLVVEAAKLAEQALYGRTRKKGSSDGNEIPDVIHAYRVAIRLARAGITDEMSIATALLHDVVEDTHITAQNIEDAFGKEFGEEIGRELATNVFFLSKNFNSEYTIPEAGCFDRMKRASQTVRRVKYADRIDNLRSFHIMRDLNEDMGRGISVRESYWKNLDETERYILQLDPESDQLRNELINSLQKGNQRLGRKNMFLRRVATQVPIHVSDRS